MAKFSDIFQFTRFRRYLEEYQEKRNEVEEGFTRRAFCVELGLPNTRSYFNDIVQGKRLTSKMSKRFIQVIDMDEVEAKYFLAMVDFDQTDDSVLRAQSLEIMMRLHPNPAHILHPDSFEYYSRWYHSTVFALLDVFDVAEDCTLLEEKIYPKVNKAKLAESIQLLVRLGLIRKNDAGFWKPVKDRIYSGLRNQNELVKQYQIQSLELSKKALELTGEESQIMNTMVFSISKESSKELKQEVDRFLEKARAIVAKDSNVPSEVQQLNLHLFSNVRRGK